MNNVVESKNDVVLKVADLKKSFGSFEVLKGVSFELRKSEIIGLLGPNGAGKTTILHIIMGLTTPTSGSITVLGKDISDRRSRSEILQKMNFSSTYIALPFSLTVREALIVFARLYRVKNIKERVSEVISRFELEDIYNREIRTLSSGQQTRLNLAKAFINEPEILLLDEPTASLDPDIANRIRSFLKEIIAMKKISIIYTSHNMQEMEEMSDRVIFLNEGKIVAEGKSVEVIRGFGSRNLEDVFLKIARGNINED